jgi:hypothetical protein
MVVLAFYAVALTAAAWGLRARRGTFGISWERSLTCSLIQLSLALVLIAPATKPYTGWLLWKLTGKWHLDDMLGHMLMLGAMVSSNLAGMLRMPTMRRYIMPLLWCPLVFGTAVLMQLFWRSVVTHDPGNDLFQLSDRCWLTAYFALLWALVIYYGSMNAWIAWCHLRGDPRARLFALVWLVCAGLGVGAVVGFALPRLHITAWHDFVRPAVCASVTAHAVSAGMSWRRKMRPYRKLIRATRARL